MIFLRVAESQSGVRLDRIVRKALPLMSLSGVYSLIRKGGVRAAGRKVKQDYRVNAGDELSIDADASELAPRESAPDTRSIERLVSTEFYKKNFRVLYEDDEIIACDKPAGLVVHPGSGHLRGDTLIDLAAAYLLTGKKIEAAGEIAPLHRLDRDTSGVILIAKSKPSARRLNDALRSRLLTKTYIAICHGRPPRAQGDVTARIARGRDERGETTMRLDERGDFSRSFYRLESFHHGVSRLEVELDTGKTHQIRIHLAHIGTPIIGDTRYGDAALDSAFFSHRHDLPRRLYLHAWKIAIPRLPPGKNPLALAAPPPEAFRRSMEEGGRRVEKVQGRMV